MTLAAELYDFMPVFGGTGSKYDPVYASPKSPGGVSRVTECYDPTYDPWDDPCPNVKKRIHVKAYPVPEVQRLYRYGRTVGELLWGSGICLIKEEWVARIEPEGFTGLEFRPVHLYRDRKCREPLEGYVELRAAGRVAVDLEGSGIRAEYACPFCGFTRYSSWKEERGLRFLGEPESWPDVFMPDPPVILSLLARPRFARLMVDLGLRPFMLVRLEDMKPFKPFPDWRK